METSAPNRILWVDLETTGLDPVADSILEVGLRITDVEGNKLQEVTTLVWTPDWRSRIVRIDAVFSMHNASGLIHDLEDLDRHHASRHEYTPREIESALMSWVHVNLGDLAGTLPMAGNSIHHDRGFLARHMPDLCKFWHYRNLDMSAMREACRLVNPELFKSMPEVVHKHRPQADIDNSITLWQWLCDNFLWVA